jgi:hypothetical protein
VYSTLYRSYWNPSEWNRHRKLMIALPLIAFVGSIMLYSLGKMVFWKCLAYLAVFHFIRQQYGFMRIYSRKEERIGWKKRSEAAIIYAAALYPIVYWHFAGDRNFHWFIEGDFFSPSHSSTILNFALVAYCTTIAGWFFIMGYEIFRVKKFNLPKHALIAGTYLSWYFGIVYFNGDFAFTALNVVSHGIPYMALIWFAQRKEKPQTNTKGFVKRFTQPQSVLVFIAALFILAFVEEAVWDSLCWRDHAQYFGWLYFLPQLISKDHLTILVPLLSLPQTTHYLLDGFIWKVSKTEVKESLGLSRE